MTVDSISPTDLAWLAGLLEGEGCFYALRNSDKQRYRYPAVDLKMNDEDVVRRASLLMGATWVTNTHPPTAKNTAYVTRVQGKRALQVMRLVLPYMGARRTAKIKELFSLFEKGEK